MSPKVITNCCQLPISLETIHVGHKTFSSGSSDPPGIARDHDVMTPLGCGSRHLSRHGPHPPENKLKLRLHVGDKIEHFSLAIMDQRHIRWIYKRPTVYYSNRPICIITDRLLEIKKIRKKIYMWPTPLVQASNVSL